MTFHLRFRSRAARRRLRCRSPRSSSRLQLVPQGRRVYAQSAESRPLEVPPDLDLPTHRRAP